MVDGKWKDDESEFENYKCIITYETEINDCDEDDEAFFYFDTWKEFKNAFNKDNDNEFVLTNATIDEVI